MVGNKPTVKNIFLALGFIVLVVLSFFGVMSLISPAKSNPVVLGPAASQSADQGKNNSDSGNCGIKEQKLSINGDSMKGLYASGTVATALMGYFQCNSGKTGDIILYNFPGYPEPLIKQIKAAPGDTFSLVKSDKAGLWRIVVNGQQIKNSEGKLYEIADTGYRMLKLYADNYKGTVPDGAYIILGNDTAGSLDSTRFGLVGQDDFLGKIK